MKINLLENNPLLKSLDKSVSVHLAIQLNVNVHEKNTSLNDGKAIEIVMKSSDEDRWVNFQIVEFQKLGEDGYRYITKNPVGNVINMDFYGNQDRLMVTIVALNDRIILRNTKHYSYDNRKFK